MTAQERVALIVGGDGPTGQAVARELVRRNWRVALGGASLRDLQAAAERLSAAAPADRVAVCPADVARAEDREQLVEFALDEFERIDLLVVAWPSPAETENLLELSEESLGRTLHGCLVGPLLLTERVANEMVRLTEAGEIEAPRIVLVNSYAAEATSPGQAASCLVSAATAMVACLFADALAEHGIAVYEVRAGLISTPRADDARARFDRLIEQGAVPVRRWGHPQDVALAVAAIADDLLPYSTGQVIHVDGGLHLKRL